MNQRIINLFDQYTHKPLPRSEFLKKLAKLTGSMAAALAVLPLLEVNYANAATVTDQDLEIITGKIEYPNGDEKIEAYQAAPSKDEKTGAVVVIHENRGLNPHIEDVARRVAKAGFLAIAPDALSIDGGTPADTDQARTLIRALDRQKTLSRFVAAVDYLEKHANSNGNVGCVGFCWGGRMANQLAVNASEMKAAVAFYGSQPTTEDVAKIKGKVMLHYGSLDERINKGIPDYTAALKKEGVPYELFMYEGANHAFHNDTAPTRYNEAAAKLAWQRTIDFFRKELE